MSAINDGGYAFPVASTIYPNGQVQFGTTGMSLRAYIATAALQGMLASPKCCQDMQAVTECALERADALIAELAKDKP